MDYDILFPISAYVDYLFCSTSSYLRHVEGVRPSLGSKAVLGAVIHRALQTLLLREYEAACRFTFKDSGASSKDFYKNVIQEILNYIKKELEGSKSGSAEYAVPDIKLALLRWSNLILSGLQRSAEESGLEGMELAGRTVPFRHVEVLYWCQEIGISGGRVDILEDNVPVEIKSKKGYWAKSSGVHRLQTALQGLLIEAVKCINVDDAKLLFVFNCRCQPVSLNAELRKWALNLRDEAIDTLTRETPPDNGGCKRWCSLAKHCPSANSKHHIKSEPMRPQSRGGVVFV